MSELVAGMLLDDPGATPPPPDQSPGSLSAVRPTASRSWSPPQAHPPPRAIAELPRRPRVAGAIVVALVVALGLVAVLAAVLFSS